MKIRYILPVMLLSASNAIAAGLTLDSSQRQPLYKHMSYLFDESGYLTVEDIIKEKKFKSLQGKVPSFGFTKKTLWLKATILNPSSGIFKKILQIERTWLDEIDVYQVHNGKIIHEW